LGLWKAVPWVRRDSVWRTRRTVLSQPGMSF
jgi:hypothetical protein